MSKESTFIRVWLKTHRKIKLLAEMRRRSIIQTVEDLVNSAFAIAIEKELYEQTTERDRCHLDVEGEPKQG